MSTADELNEQLKATAAAYNAENPTGNNEDDAEAQVLAQQVSKLEGSRGHNGAATVVAETAEEAAAYAAKKAEEAAAAAEAAKTPEEKAADKKAAEDLAAVAAKEVADKEAEEAAALAKARADETPEEKVAREAAEKTKAEQDSAWMTSDNKEFNASLNLMKAAGMTAARAAELFDTAAQTGDLNKVDRAALVAEVGADAAELIMAGFTSYVETEGTAVLERLRAVQDSVGGTDNWATMTKWAKAKAKGDAKFRGSIESITTMLNSGDAMQSNLAASEFLKMYNADDGNSTLAPTGEKEVTTLHTPVVPTKTSVVPMSSREYAEEVDKAQRTLRGGDQVARLAELSASRAAGRSKGL